MTSPLITTLPVAGVAYLLGSIPFGLLLTAFSGGGDIRKIGSGNIGATNVLRTGRKGLAAATLLLDALKGAIAIVIAARLGLTAPALAVSIAAVAVVIGHCFPVWLNFRGGKGVATGLGVIWVLSWPVGLLICLFWLAVARLSRISSAGALSAFLAAPLLMLFWYGTSRITLATLCVSALIWSRHHSNIRRLLNGTEPRIGQTKNSV